MSWHIFDICFYNIHTCIYNIYIYIYILDINLKTSVAPQPVWIPNVQFDLVKQHMILHQWNFQHWHGGTVSYKAIFLRHIPLHRPYVYGRYLNVWENKKTTCPNCGNAKGRLYTIRKKTIEQAKTKSQTRICTSKSTKKTEINQVVYGEKNTKDHPRPNSREKEVMCCLIDAR
jgi:hypothetical protein